mmetsp:Transcript_780/g.2819  ORF Transcript_780/g.2819 Transcript_780/m.2819 type:complete len:251 (-) Transcript_780:1254-2006(-)
MPVRILLRRVVVCGEGRDPGSEAVDFVDDARGGDEEAGVLHVKLELRDERGHEHEHRRHNDGDELERLPVVPFVHVLRHKVVHEDRDKGGEKGEDEGRPPQKAHAHFSLVASADEHLVPHPCIVHHIFVRGADAELNEARLTRSKGGTEGHEHILRSVQERVDSPNRLAEEGRARRVEITELNHLRPREERRRLAAGRRGRRQARHHSLPHLRRALAPTCPVRGCKNLSHRRQLLRTHPRVLEENCRARH